MITSRVSALPLLQRQILWLLAVAIGVALLPAAGHFFFVRPIDRATREFQDSLLGAVNSSHDAISTIDELILAQTARLAATPAASIRDDEWSRREISLLSRLSVAVERLDSLEKSEAIPEVTELLQRLRGQLAEIVTLSREKGSTLSARDRLQAMRLTLEQDRLLQVEAYVIEHRKREATERRVGLVIVPATACLVLLGGVICVLMFRAIAREYRREVEIREALRESEARLRAIFDSEPECVKLLDENGGLIEINPAGLAMVEAEFAEQLAGKNALDLVAPEHRRQFLETVTAAFDGRATRQEFEIVGLRGTRRWLEQYAVPLWDESRPGRVKQMLAVTRDISDRKRGEDELKRSRQRFQDLFEFAPEAILMTDHAGVIVLANRRVEVLFGWKREELIGQKVERLVPDEFGSRHEELRERYMQNPVPRPMENARANLQARRRDGTVFPVEITLSPMELEEGTVVAAAIRDVTERVENERIGLRIQRLQSIGTLAGGIAHDLNNTLAPIRLSVEMLRQRFPAIATEYLDLIENSAKRGGDMTRQLLMFARGSGGERVPIDPTRVLNEIDRILVSTFPKNIRLETKYGKDLAWVSCDATQVHQLLLNLCVNARDAMPQGGTLTVEAANFQADAAFVGVTPEARPGPYLVLRVRDTGTGIPPAILDRIFDPFFTTKGPEKGTGLGLATALGIAKGHGGFFRVNSLVGDGSTFEVYLPALARGNAAPDRPATLEWRGAGELVLVVDDEPPIRQVLQRMLNELNFEVVTAANGRDALIQFGEHRGDVKLVLTDLAMPVMDGLNLVQSLRQLAPGLGIITMTGLEDESRLERLEELGVAQNLVKPFSKAGLLAALQIVLPHPGS